METSRLVPFVREGLDILFVGLNPANGSDDNGHYFSVNQAFWNQLYESGLITEKVDKLNADDIIFRTNKKNYNGWHYGITDLVPNVVDSNAKNVKPTNDNCKKLKELMQKLTPRVVILLHKTVVDLFLSYIGAEYDGNESGRIGRIIENCTTMFYAVPFPHGNNVKSKIKIERYEEIKKFLEEG